MIPCCFREGTLPIVIRVRPKDILYRHFKSFLSKPLIKDLLLVNDGFHHSNLVSTIIRVLLDTGTLVGLVDITRVTVVPLPYMACMGCFRSSLLNFDTCV